MKLIADKNFEKQYEEAIRILGKYMPLSERKPLIPHAIRVSMYLYQNGYSSEIILASLLHDIIEWSDYPVNMLNYFGEHAVEIIKSNTQDNSIEDKNMKWQDMVDRCIANGEDATIVKAADIIDSLEYYIAADNQNEKLRSTNIGNYLIKKLPNSYKDRIFEVLSGKL